MSRKKSADAPRGRSVDLPAWWLEALRRLCAGRAHAEIAADLTAATKRHPPFRRESVGDFLSGKVTSDVMLDAFTVLFDTLPPPIFRARSYEEADQLRAVSRRYSAAVSRARAADRMVMVDEKLEIAEKRAARPDPVVGLLDEDGGSTRGVARGRSSS